MGNLLDSLRYFFDKDSSSDILRTRAPNGTTKNSIPRRLIVSSIGICCELSANWSSVSGRTSIRL